MTAPTTVPAETLIRHAWGLYEQDTECDYAANLREAVWRLEEAVDYGHDDVEALARRVIQALSVATGEEVGDILSPTPSVAAWLESDQ
ncbi:hypothetical protein [Gordonia hongkongensis]|uniref:hypothetical protein n=1 Tax=Gordonia hongkongensis TaxID=1701090 RepID=UPI001FF9789E|nr:hypothetical protein [Gordonia hongkongensis]UPG68796.1 hypothetical protein MVF96_02725 [Gordonia hongkongensis]